MQGGLQSGLRVRHNVSWLVLDDLGVILPTSSRILLLLKRRKLRLQEGLQSGLRVRHNGSWLVLDDLGVVLPIAHRRRPQMLDHQDPLI